MYSKVKLNLDHLHNNYTIDSLGVVTRNDGKVLKGTSINSNNRYVKIHLDKFYALHRLVAEHFVANPDNLPQVNHIDGNRYNNTAINLEWCTARNNVLHAYSTGLKTNAGEINPISILTEGQVIQIWALRHTNLTARQIRDKLKLSVAVCTVKAVRSGKNWSSVTSKLN